MPCVLLEELAADSWENKPKNSNDSCARRAAASSLVAVVLDVFLARILPTFATLLTIKAAHLSYMEIWLMITYTIVANYDNSSFVSSPLQIIHMNVKFLHFI
jgi:hypothetical protein